MTHLSHKLGWARLDIDNTSSLEHFARVFTQTLREFHATSSAAPNIFTDGWGFDPPDLNHHAYDVLFERFSTAGIVTSLLRTYLELNLTLAGVPGISATITGVEEAIYPAQVMQALSDLLVEDRWKPFDRPQTNRAHEFLKIIFRLLFCNLEYYDGDIEQQTLWALQNIRRAHLKCIN